MFSSDSVTIITSVKLDCVKAFKMCEDFSHQLLRLVVGRICQPLGWHAMNSNAADVLADVTRQYILTLGRTTAAYSCHDNRTEPNLVDLSQAFSDLGVSLPELTDFLQQVRSTPLDQKVPHYPIQQSSTHVYENDQSDAVVRKKVRQGSVSSQASCSSDESEGGWLPAHLPPLPSLKDEGNDDDTESGIHPTAEHSDTELMETTPTTLIPHDPTRGLPQSRPRIFSSDVSEDSGSRRSSLSDFKEGALIKAADAKTTSGNVFDSAFQHELKRSEPAAVQSSKVDQLKQDTSIVKTTKKLPLLHQTTGDNTMPTKRSSHSPLLESMPHPTSHGVPTPSPMQTASATSLPSKDSHPSKLKPPIPDSSPTIKPVPIEAQQSAPIKAHQDPSTLSKSEPQFYQLPQSPRKVPLKEFHVSTKKLSIDQIHSSSSPPNKSPPFHASKERSPKISREPSPVKSPSKGLKVTATEELEVLEQVVAVGSGLTSSTRKEGVVELEEVLFRLSETESSEDEEVVKKETEEAEVRVPSTASSPTPPASHPHTPSPPTPSSHHTPSRQPQTSMPPISPRTLSPSTPPSHPVTPVSHPHTSTNEHAYPSPPTTHQHKEFELSEDNLSISDEGSNSDLETKQQTEQSDTEQEESLDKTAVDISSDAPAKVEESMKSFVPFEIAQDKGSEIVEQVTEIQSSSLLPADFEGEVTVYSEVGGAKDDSNEMISTLSAQVNKDYLETTKVLGQVFSSDDEDSSEEEVPVFKGESQDEQETHTCTLTTSTEKVKGETKGRRRTVSKDDVLGISKPKVRRRKKGRARVHKPATIPTTPIDTPLTSLVVSIKKSLYEPQARQTTLATPTFTPPSLAEQEPLLITINRHLLRHTRFRVAPPTPEEKPKSALELFKLRFAKHSTSTPKPVQADLETTPSFTQTTSFGSRKRELELLPSSEEVVKRQRTEPPVRMESTPLSSSTSSSSDNDDDSDSLPPTPPHPAHLTHLTPSHIDPPQTPSSEDESSSSSSSESVSGASGVSSVSGGGLKLTISKAVLQQGGHSLGTGAMGWSSGKPGLSKTMKLKVSPIAKKHKGGGQRKQPPSRGPKLVVSQPVSQPYPTHPPLPQAMGSDTICPVCNFKDDGSPMIGCDNCDSWCHWRCVGVAVAPPENEKWFCPQCREKAIKRGKKKVKKSK